MPDFPNPHFQSCLDLTSDTYASARETLISDSFNATQVAEHLSVL